MNTTVRDEARAAPDGGTENGGADGWCAEKLASICDFLLPNVPALSVGEFLDRRGDERWCIVDVRPERERRVSSIPGSLGVEEFERSGDGLGAGRVLVHCTAGCRSATYVKRLRAQGVEAYVLRGGVLAWAVSGEPFVGLDGKLTWDVAASGTFAKALPPGYHATKPQ